MSVLLNGVTLPAPKRETPVLQISNRSVVDTITNAPLIYESPLKLRTYHYEWEPINASDKSTLETQYLNARFQLVEFQPLEGTGPYYAYTQNWRCSYLTRGSDTYYYSVSFDIVAVDTTT